MLPRGAESILAMRSHGRRPADPVVVSFVGDTGWGNPHVYAESALRYDWRFLAELPVIVAVRPGIEVRDALIDIFALARLYPTLADVELRQAASVIDNNPLRLWNMVPQGFLWKDLFE